MAWGPAGWGERQGECAAKMESAPRSPKAPSRGERAVDCSVLVPILNEERNIVASVAAMRRQRFDGELEFVLVDGGSSDRTPEILRELASDDPRIRLFDNPLRVTPSGLNIALRHARGRWVARMDSHTEYPDDYLARAVERLAHGDTRWVSGPQLPIGQGRISRAVALGLRSPLGRGRSRKWAAEGNSSQPEYELDSGVFCGVWERDALLEYGGWDEEWVRNQDSEMAGRFLARGERLICVPAMAARYTPRNSLSSLWRQYFEYGSFRTKTAVRHPQTMRRSHLLAPALVASAVSAVTGPPPVRRLALAGLAIYVGTLLAAGLRSIQFADPRQDALLVPVVLAVMHFGHGSGSWVRALRGEPPLAAVLNAAGLGGLAARFPPGRWEVYRPSLQAVDLPRQ